MKKAILFALVFCVNAMGFTQVLSHFNVGLNVPGYLHSNANCLELDSGYLISSNTRSDIVPTTIGVVFLDHQLNQKKFNLYSDEFRYQLSIVPGFYQISDGFVEFGRKSENDRVWAFLAKFNNTFDLDTLFTFGSYTKQQFNSGISIGNGFGIFTGVDIPLYKGLFCGTEIGYMFLSSNLQRGEYKTENAASTTNASTVDVIPSVTTKSFSLVNMGGFESGVEILIEFS